MERELYPALHAIAFLTGAALNLMLGLMQLRADRNTGRASAFQLLWLLGFIWTFGNFLQYALEVASGSPQSLGVRLAGSFAWSSTLLGPVLVGRILETRLGAANRAARAFLGFGFGASALLLALYVYAAATHDFNFDASWYPEASFYMALAVTVIALVVYRTQRASADPTLPAPKRRWFRLVVVLLIIVQVGATLLTIQYEWITRDLHAVASLISRHWTIPWAILIAVSLAQVHYADVVLKRSLWLLVSVSAATLASVFVFRVPAGAALLVATLVTAALMLLAPALVRALEVLVDRKILHRPDYREATQKLEDSLRRTDNPQQLIDAALEAVRSTLHLEARWVTENESRAPSPGVLASIPVESADGTRHRLEAAASHQARTLMQQEQAFLNSVASMAAHRLESQRLEQEQRALMLREERLRRLLTEAELKALRTQVDPHFLFNTLNTIADLISSNPAQAERMTERLAECFRYALSKHSRDLSTLDEELDFARHYLEIEQVRFGDRLRVELSRGDARGNEPVPSLLLQPLLENAIRHGLAPIREGGCVSVMAQREGGRLRLRVEDDGAGLRPDFRARLGVGLRNVQERLQTLYAETAEFLIGGRAGGRGTSVSIVVPLQENS